MALNNRLMNHFMSKSWLYNISWEDPLVDYDVLEMCSSDDIFYITSGGDNALTYLAKGVNSVTCVDLNPRQNYLLELKQACVLAFNREEFFEIFGNDNMTFLYQNFDKILPYLSKDATCFFEKKPLKSFIYSGAAAIVAWTVGPMWKGFCSLQGVGKSKFYHMPVERCSSFLRFAPQAFALTAPSQGVPKAQVEMVLEDPLFFKKWVTRVLNGGSLRDNYFYYPYLTGKMNAEACFDYMKPGAYENLKVALKEGRLSIHTDSVAHYLSETDKSFDKFVMLDHYDWMSPAQVSEEYTQVRRRAKVGASLLFRSASRRMPFPTFEDKEFLISDEITLGMEYKGKPLPNDRVGSYASIHVFKID